MILKFGRLVKVARSMPETIEFKCSGCDQVYVLPVTQIGRMAKCRACNTRGVVGGSDERSAREQSGTRRPAPPVRKTKRKATAAESFERIQERVTARKQSGVQRKAMGLIGFAAAIAFAFVLYRTFDATPKVTAGNSAADVEQVADVSVYRENPPAVELSSSIRLFLHQQFPVAANSL